MKRICGFVIGLALLVMAPVAVIPALTTADPGARSMDYQQATDVVIMRGLSQRGVPFSWAGGGVSGPTLGKGTGMTTVGFDASGLMQYAYAGAGIKLPRSSGELYRVGQKVLPQQARRGDLIFYGPDGTQSVAMYLGNNQMLEVGDVVQVSPVRANGMTPYLVRVLGTQQTPLQQAPAQQAPVQQAPAPPYTHLAAGAGTASATAAGTRSAGAGTAGTVAAGTRSAGAGTASTVAAGTRSAGTGTAGAIAADAVAIAHAGAGPADPRAAGTFTAGARHHAVTLGPPKTRHLHPRRPDLPASGKEQVAVFGKLAVDHGKPRTASSTGRHGDTGVHR